MRCNVKFIVFIQCDIETHGILNGSFNQCIILYHLALKKKKTKNIGSLPYVDLPDFNICFQYKIVTLISLPVSLYLSQTFKILLSCQIHVMDIIL